MGKASSASCGGEHSLFVDSEGNSFSSGACGLGWYGTMAGAQTKETIAAAAKPCKNVHETCTEGNVPLVRSSTIHVMRTYR